MAQGTCHKTSTSPIKGIEDSSLTKEGSFFFHPKLHFLEEGLARGRTIRGSLMTTLLNEKKKKCAFSCTLYYGNTFGRQVMEKTRVFDSLTKSGCNISQLKKITKKKQKTMIHNCYYFKKLYTPDEQNRLSTYFNTISEKEKTTDTHERLLLVHTNEFLFF